MYREELLRWLLIIALSLWAIGASVLLITRKDKLVVIAVSDDTSYVVRNTNQTRERKELLSFVKLTIEKLYSFTPETFSHNLTMVSDLMSEELWALKREQFERLNQRLQKDPLTQTSKIVSVNDLGDGKIQAQIEAQIRHKLEVKTINLKVDLEIRKRQRSESNPWMYEVTGLKDETL